MFRTRFSPADGVVLLVVLLLALLLFFLPFLWRDTGEELLVTTPEGSTSYALTENRKITVVSGGHTLTVEIRDGKAAVLESDCPDGICVRSGKIGKSGQSILCAPAGVRLLIIGGRGNDNVDFVAG